MGSLRVAFYDMVLLNKFYGCNCDNHPRKLDCKNGGYQNPANCEECLCTDGFNGQLCDQHEGVYVLEAKKEWDASGVRNNYRKGIETNTMPEYTYFALTVRTIRELTRELKKIFRLQKDPQLRFVSPNYPDFSVNIHAIIMVLN